MAALRRFFRRLGNLLRPGRAEQELTREVASHLALIEEDYQRRGLPPEQARRAARLALGGVEQAKDRHRDARSFVWVEDARRDALHALRLLRRNPIATITAALSLAIGIGANTAIFTVANGLLFRPPAGIAEPDRLVNIGTGRDGRGEGGFNPASYPAYLDVRRRATLLDGVYAHDMFPKAMSLGGAGASAETERVFSHAVTINYFTVLGVTPAAGRLFGAGDSEQPGASPVVVLSHGFWMRRFNSDPAIAGRVIRLNGHPFTIVGVAPEGFHGTGLVTCDLWVPVTMSAAMQSSGESAFHERAGGWLIIGARLKRGATQEAAAAEVSTIGADLQREYPEAANASRLRLAAVSAVPGARDVMTIFVGLLLGIVSLVLLVACANVSGMLLARAAARRQEMAVRLAIGAGRARLVRQLLMETIILFAIGGVAGLALARVMTTVAVALLPALPFPVTMSLALDVRVIALTMGLSLVAALFAGLAPARQASKTDPLNALKEDSQALSGRARLRRAFVVAQVACSLVLVITAGLFTRALERAGSVDPGFDPRGVELTTLNLSMAGYTDATGPLFWQELLDRVRPLPGVEQATVARVLPGGFEGLGLDISTPETPPDQRFDFEVDCNIVAPGYFATLRIPLVSGRDFTDADRAGSQPVIIVGESAARRYWPGRNALGKFLVQSVRVSNATAPVRKMLLVVGVAHDIKNSSLVDGLSEAFLYVPLQQQSRGGMTSEMTIVTRTSQGRSATEAIRPLVASMNPNLPIVSSQTLADSVALGLVPQRLFASIAGSLGLVGLLLAAIGIYGVTAFAVTCRAREFGIRAALGAKRSDIVGMVLRQGLSLTVIGCAIGLALGALVGRVLGGFLFGVPALDPVAFGGAAALFAAIGLAACYGPARRATTVDPLVTLRRD
jgi:predicted permease